MIRPTMMVSMGCKGFEKEDEEGGSGEGWRGKQRDGEGDEEGRKNGQSVSPFT